MSNVNKGRVQVSNLGHTSITELGQWRWNTHSRYHPRPTRPSLKQKNKSNIEIEIGNIIIKNIEIGSQRLNLFVSFILTINSIVVPNNDLYITTVIIGVVA